MSDPAENPLSPNAEELPVLHWEFVERRVRISSELQKVLGIPVSTLRWSRQKFEAVCTDHRRDLKIIENIESHLRDWQAAGPEEGHPQTWQVIFTVEKRTCIAIIGCDGEGSFNMVTVFGTKKKGFIERRSTQPGMTMKRREASAPLDEAEIS